MPGLHLVHDVEDAVLARERGHLAVEFRGRDDVAPLALDRLHEDGGHFIGRHGGAEERLLDPAHAVELARRVGQIVGAAVAVGVGDVGDARHQGVVVLLLHRLAGGERQRPHGAAVEGAEEGDVELALGVPARQLEGGLDRLGAGVPEIDAVDALPGRQRGELLRERDLRRVVEVGPGHVQQPVGLVLDGRDDPGVAVARGVDGDAGREVQEPVPVHVLDPQALPPVGHQRVGPRVGRGHVGRILADQLLGAGAGQRGADFRFHAVRVLRWGRFEIGAWSGISLAPFHCRGQGGVDGAERWCMGG